MKDGVSGYTSTGVVNSIGSDGGPSKAPLNART